MTREKRPKLDPTLRDQSSQSAGEEVRAMTTPSKEPLPTLVERFQSMKVQIPIVVFHGGRYYPKRATDDLFESMKAALEAKSTDKAIVEEVKAAGQKYLDERDKEYQSLKEEGEDEMGRDWTWPYMAAELNKKAGAEAMLKIVLALLSPEATE